MAEVTDHGIIRRSSSGNFLGYSCLHCGADGDYSTSYDSFACLNCKIWLDLPCACHRKKNPSLDCPYYPRPEFPTVTDTPFGDVVY